MKKRYTERSLPTRGGWIETEITVSLPALPASLPTRGGWIETQMYCSIRDDGTMSLPTRGGWIETSSG